MTDAPSDRSASLRRHGRTWWLAGVAEGSTASVLIPILMPAQRPTFIAPGGDRRR
jgi:hypothetical protein